MKQAPTRAERLRERIPTPRSQLPPCDHDECGPTGCKHTAARNTQRIPREELKKAMKNDFMQYMTNGLTPDRGYSFPTDHVEAFIEKHWPKCVQSKPVEEHLPGAEVRPSWDSLCKCVSVRGAVSLRRPHETEEGYKLRVTRTVRSNYESGADWLYDADCKLCESGVKKVEQEKLT